MEFEGVEFKLTDHFLDKYRNRTPDWGPLGELVYYRTYSRPLEDGSRERWWQTVQRIVEGTFLIQKRHCLAWRVPWKERKAQFSAQQMYDCIFSFKFLPPGRGIWSMGTQYALSSSAGLQNCGVTTTENISSNFSAPFVWTMDALMHGVGIGYDVKGAYGREVLLRKPRQASDTHVINDSKEGWVEAVRRVLDAYVGVDTLPQSFDYTNIRPAGSPIRSFGGIAPGPDPLKKLVRRLTSLLDRYVKTQEPIDAAAIVDIFNFIGESVVSGGVRRSSLLALGHADDGQFLDLKTEKTISDPSLARWASNNSVVGEVGMDYSEVARRAAQIGEPGLVWLDNCRRYGRFADGRTDGDMLIINVNPCGEQPLESSPSGEGELCTLVETIPSRHESLADYLKTLKSAYLYGKTVTLLTSHYPGTNAIMLKNRRIGLSQTGVIDNIARIGFREHMRWSDEGYKEIQRLDRIYSDWLCIPRSIKTTTVKPSGSVSLLPGVSPGVHFPHSEYYIRRVRVSKNAGEWRTYKDAGYTVEPDQYEREHTMVIEIPVHEKHFLRGKDEVSLWEQLEMAAQMQHWWSDNAVSVTVTVRPEEERDLARALSFYETRLKSVSFLPVRGDQVYKQAPYEAISAEEYERRVAGLKPVDLFTAGVEVKEERFCDGDSCQL